MKLVDCDFGDLVAIDEDGETVFVVLNYLMCASGKKAVPHSALVDLVDPESLAVIPHSWCSKDPQLEVIAVIETGLARRADLAAARAARFRRVGVTDAVPDAGREIDPLLAGERNW